MESSRQLYLMVSQTHTGIARMIRAVSRYPYNHVSVTLDSGFRTWYSFARYVQDAPLYSGFIRESAERFLAAGDPPVQIFRLDVPQETARHLEQLIPLAGSRDSGLIYNYFDAVSSALGFRLTVPNSHTCLSFACELLDRQDLTIEALCTALRPCLIYEGPLSALVADSGSRTDAYFGSLGLVRGSSQSLLQLCTLTCRAVVHGFESYIANYFRRTAR